MKTKITSLNFISSIIITLFLLVNITVPVQAAIPKLNSKTISKVISSVVNVSASVSNKTPLQNTTVNVTVNGPAKGSVKIICHYKSTNSTYTATIASNGKVIMPVKISRATKKYTVIINVSVTYKSKIYTTKTSFTPR